MVRAFKRFQFKKQDIVFIAAFLQVYQIYFKSVFSQHPDRHRERQGKPKWICHSNWGATWWFWVPRWFYFWHLGSYWWCKSWENLNELHSGFYEKILWHFKVLLSILSLTPVAYNQDEKCLPDCLYLIIHQVVMSFFHLIYYMVEALSAFLEPFVS